MTGIKGYADEKKSTAEGAMKHGTLGRIGEGQIGLDVRSWSFIDVVADGAEAGSTATVINATAHLARVGDLISWLTGALTDREYFVDAITANTITLEHAMAAAPAAGNAFMIRRRKAAAVAAGGAAVVTTVPISTASKQKLGKQAFGDVDAAYSTLISGMGFDARIIYIFNSLDTTIRVSIDSGVTDAFELETGESFSIDLGSAGLMLPNGATNDIEVKHTGVAPTVGTIRGTVIG